MTVTVRYFAAAAERAGRDEEKRAEQTLLALRTALSEERVSLGEILPRCAVMVDGVRRDTDAPLPDGAVVDVLPPFAGG